jgi:osmotically-inducible protein OsmY
VLLGQVSSYQEKCAAARAALRADGVLFVHNRLEVVLTPEARMSDADLRGAALGALQREPNVPAGLITVEVRSGRVTLRGVVDLPLQIDAALAAVRRLAGMLDLRNELRLRGRPAELTF